MAENPLLPHQRLKDLYALMQRVYERIASGPPSLLGLEAVLAATAIQLEFGDVFCAKSPTTVRDAVLRRSKPATSGLQPYADALRDAALPEISSLIAFGLKATLQKSVAVSVTSTATDLDWNRVLKQAQHARLPQVFLLAEARTPAGDGSLLPWSGLMKFAKAANIPTISVDGEDAVALYRVLQESLHRARLGDGPTVIWCARTSTRQRVKRSAAIASLEHYLAARGLLGPSGKRSTPN